MLAIVSRCIDLYAIVHTNRSQSSSLPLTWWKAASSRTKVTKSAIQLNANYSSLKLYEVKSCHFVTEAGKVGIKYVCMSLRWLWHRGITSITPTCMLIQCLTGLKLHQKMHFIHINVHSYISQYYWYMFCNKISVTSLNVWICDVMLTCGCQSSAPVWVDVWGRGRPALPSILIYFDRWTDSWVAKGGRLCLWFENKFQRPLTHKLLQMRKEQSRD